MTSLRMLDRETAPDILMVTFDSLRFDVAEQAYRDHRTLLLESLLPVGWERRHSPGNFTYAAHAALFAGFWPTPSSPGAYARPFALRFPGSRTVDDSTITLEGHNIIEGFQRCGFHTVCIGGVGFFNKRTPLGSTFPAMFDESHWLPGFSVSEVHSTRYQIRFALDVIENRPTTQPLFLFLNVSATHPPTMGYLPGSRHDTIESQVAALSYADQQLPPLLQAMKRRNRGLKGYLMSDHGTLFGEDGFYGHRVGHPLVWTVPYGEFVLERTA
jgi:hypothetical protein